MMADATPMMRQYGQLKEQHRDAILFFRLGDFYEMFREDAVIASRILGLTLTKRQEVPMCGVPYHAARGYIARLIAAGKKVAICEQTRLPEGGKGIAEREVVEVVTPGTVVEEDYLRSDANNYLVALAADSDLLSIAYIDLSTGHLGLSGRPLSDAATAVRTELSRLAPRELLVQESLLERAEIARVLTERSDALLNRYPDWQFDRSASFSRLCTLLGVQNLKAFGIQEADPVLLAAGTLIDYVRETSHSTLSHVREIALSSAEQRLELDESTIRNLEVTANLQDSGRKYSLLEVIDFTQTSMGSRLLRRWLLSPLRDRAEIERRQHQVTALYRSQATLGSIRQLLNEVLDLERLAGRIAMERAHAKDLVAVGTSLRRALKLSSLISSSLPECLAYQQLVTDYLAAATQLAQLIERALLDEPSTVVTEGRLIRVGYDPELDRLKAIAENSREVLEGYVAEERSQTGVSSIRVRHNRVLGYFLEVSKANGERLPPRFVRRQSLSNAERFTTERLGDIEREINEAGESIVERERELFFSVLGEVEQQLTMLLAFSGALAELDVLQSFAQAATVRGYNAPELFDDTRMVIEAGRHPVVEAHMPPGEFVPNGVSLDHEEQFLALITGPNMAGKSTYLRQAALIVLLAQTGSYVPADVARIGLADRIFCRVGASDNLARGESTFLVEMNEAAFILRNATTRSLVIMDEIGRGTSTNDGRAIAQAVLEYLTHKVRPRTLFATHFHTLTSVTAPGLFNLSLGVTEQNGRIVFLNRVQEGASNNSYGIHVARLAGVPHAVIERAQEILQAVVEHEEPELSLSTPQFNRQEKQAALFDPAELILSELRAISVNEMKPVEALARIARWQEELDL
jgi:DNA mismatch repair protein MutS